MPAPPSSAADIRGSIVAALADPDLAIDAMFDAELVVSLEDCDDVANLWGALDKLSGGALAPAQLAIAGRTRVEMMVTVGNTRLQYSSDDEDLCSFANVVLEELRAPGRLFRVDSQDFVGYFTDAEAARLRDTGVELEDY